MIRPINISREGLFAGELVATYELDDSLKCGVQGNRSFQHYQKIVSRGTKPDTVVLGGVTMPMGVITDVAPDGNTCGVDTAGYIWVVADCTGVNYGDVVTCVPGGTLQAIAGYSATEDEKRAGCWQADKVDPHNNRIQIMIDCYL